MDGGRRAMRAASAAIASAVASDTMCPASPISASDCAHQPPLPSTNANVNVRPAPHKESYSDLAGRAHDSGEESVADLLADMNITMIDRQVQELRRVEAALRRMDMGTYGECDECGCEIGYERLRSYPTAGRCVECQAQYEHTHAHEPTPSL